MSKTAKSVISCLVVVLIFTSLVGVLGFASKGFKNWDTKTWFQKEQVVEKPATPPAVTDGDGNDMTEGKVYDMPARMSFSDASTASVGNVVTINAVITPANATIKDLTWAIRWQNPASTWATGKVITDYFTLTPNAQQAGLSCLQPFGERIVISVTSVENPTAKAECVVDFEKRISNLQFALASGTNTINFTDHSDEMIYNVPFTKDIQTINILPTETQKFMPQVTYTEGVGTVAPILETSVSVGFTLSFGNILGKVDIDQTKSNLGFNKYNISNGIVFDKSFVELLLGVENTSGKNVDNVGYAVKSRAYDTAFKSHCIQPLTSSDDSLLTSNFEWHKLKKFSHLQFSVSVHSKNGDSLSFNGFAKIDKFLDYASVSSVSLSDTNLQF